MSVSTAVAESPPTGTTWRARWGRATTVLLVLGATLGVALDHVHVATGTTAYADPWWIDHAWWAFPLFAVAPVILGLARPVLERLGGVDPTPPTLAMAAAAMGLFVAAYLASGVMDAPDVVTALVIGALGVAAWWLADRRALGVLLAVGAAIGGTVVESTLVAAGLFSYTDPGPFGVEPWLPVLYAVGGVAVGALGSFLVDGEPGVVPAVR